MKKLNKYYFTFGQAHCQIDGTPMKDYWITVIAEDYEKARDLFIKEFSSQFMSSPDKWAFQYAENDNLDFSYFKKGNYLTIVQNETENQKL